MLSGATAISDRLKVFSSSLICILSEGVSFLKVTSRLGLRLYSVFRNVGTISTFSENMIDRSRVNSRSLSIVSTDWDFLTRCSTAAAFCDGLNSLSASKTSNFEQQLQRDIVLKMAYRLLAEFASSRHFEPRNSLHRCFDPTFDSCAAYHRDCSREELSSV